MDTLKARLKRHQSIMNADSNFKLAQQIVFQNPTTCKTRYA